MMSPMMTPSAGANDYADDDAADRDEGDDDEYDWGGWCTAMMMVLMNMRGTTVMITMMNAKTKDDEYDDTTIPVFIRNES